ncbi:MAG: BON domain-containing protein [Gammaproteobacteria bacterium]|nr:BON domain-containing protein [Gammaproteobacteria bacterium]
MKKLFILLTLVLLSQGCVFVAGAAAGAAGIAIVYDHRKLEKILLDQRLAHQINDEIAAIPELRDHTRVDVTCFNQVVLLTGQASTAEQRQRIGDIAHSLSDVTRVYNQINVNAPASSLTQASDAWITTKIKTQMLATKGLESSSIKVVTENGSVYLLGIVSHDQADTTIDIARKVAGVQRVVTIFQYTN